MASHPSLNKIQPDHLDRDTLIYVRRSSLIQVRDNTASTMRQYDLVQRALGLGWPRERIQVIDQDQGHSGSSTIGRDGFQSLVAEVGLKHCGAVVSFPCCTIPFMQEPTSMGEPKPVGTRFPARLPGSRGAHARSSAKTGQLCCWMLILPTFLGSGFGAINRSWTTIAHGGQRSDGEPSVKDRRFCKESCCVELVVAA